VRIEADDCDSTDGQQRCARNTGLSLQRFPRAEPQEETRRRKVDLAVLPTAQALGVLTGTTKDTSAVLHLTW